MTDPGDMLGNHYRVREVLAGGMGQVFICDFLYSGKSSEHAPIQVALKTFQRRYFFNNAVRLSFIREASTWMRLAGVPHVMPVSLIDTIDNQPYIVMPAVKPGLLGERSIADLLHHGPFTPGDALANAFQIGFALHQASSRIPGIIHGDIKPDNVLLIDRQAFISDFGLVSAITLGNPDVRLEGTWRYRAPELWADATIPFSVAGDIYAFGVMLFEMLTGHLPVTPERNARDDWRVAHSTHMPRIPVGFPNTGLPAAAMALALHCLTKDPIQRPADFMEVVDHIISIYTKFDFVDDISLLMRQAYEQSVVLPAQTPRMCYIRVNGLQKLGEFAQALEELDGIPYEKYDARLWVTRGVTLISLDRHEEAIEALQRGLEGELSEEDQIGAYMELSLALKRLNRFSEAEEVLQALMLEVPIDELGGIVVNLASLHLEQHNGEAAVRLLEPFVLRTPDVAGAWANLGQGYALIGRHEDAVKAFGRSLTLVPQSGLVRVMLATVYMEHFGFFEEAYAALDAAFESGYDSRESFVRRLAVSWILGRHDSVQKMLWETKYNMPESLGTELIAETNDLVRKLGNRFGSESPKEADSVVTFEDDDSGISVGHACAPISVASPSDPLKNNQVSNRRISRIPFLNVRVINFMYFTIDYYNHISAPNFISQLRREIRSVLRDPQFAEMSGGLRGSPFIFIVCPVCNFAILTNRDVGESVLCRMCNTPFDAISAVGSKFESILPAVSAELGNEGFISGEPSDVHVLFLQVPRDVSMNVATELCRDMGMTELEKSSLMSMYMFKNATKRGMSKWGLSWSVWTLPSSSLAARSPTSTPDELLPIISGLHGLISNLVTFTATVSSEMVASLEETVEEVDAMAEQELRAVIYSGDAQPRELRQLAALLDRRGNFQEAEQKARAAIAAENSSPEGWEILGRILFHQMDYLGSREALETAHALDPTSNYILRMLAVCCENLGNEDLARELWAQAMSLTGGELI